MTGQRSAPRGDRILRIGLVLTAIGLVCTLIACIPLLVPSIQLPSSWWFLSMITGVGLVVVIIGLVVSGGDRRRAVRR